jgi:hypothetical protein
LCEHLRLERFLGGLDALVDRQRVCSCPACECQGVFSLIG